MTKDEVAQLIITESKRRGHTREETIAELADAIQESGLRGDAVSPNGLWRGVYQQDASYPGRDDPAQNVKAFFDRLDKKRTDPGHGDIWQNIFWLQQRPGEKTAWAAWTDPNARRAYMTEIQSRTDEATRFYDRLAVEVPLKSDQSETLVASVKPGWTGDPVWLEDVLRPALGDRLKTLPGWKDAGHGDFRDIRGIVVHHTGNSRETAPSIRNGRSDLEGPLSQLHIAPDGTVTIVAAGVAWHAGVGAYPWLPTNMANWHMIGIECAWPDIGPGGSYDAGQRWPDAQIIAMRDTCAAIIGKLGFTAERVIGHKEWAGRAQGKWDPGNMDMNWFRSEVGKDMAGGFDEHVPLEPDKPGASHPPVIQPPGTPPVGAYAHVLLHYGMNRPEVAALQARLKKAYSRLEVDGIYGSHTARAVADYQRLHPPLDVDGIVGPATAAALQLPLTVTA